MGTFKTARVLTRLMKHTLPITIILVTVFLAAQLLGLGLITAGTHVSTAADGSVVVSHEDTVLGPRPETTGFASFTYLLIGVAVGTGILLLLIRFRLLGVWKLWFFVAVWLAITISLGAAIGKWFGLGLALVLAIWKIWRPNIIIHNLTEILVYSGIALLIVPILNLFYAALLLVVIAIYDAYAVWKSKHMVTLAEFQTESKLFAGLLVPYSVKQARTRLTAQPTIGVKAVKKAEVGKSAILGGGDIAFPLLFAGVVMDTLLGSGLTKIAAYGYSLIVVAGAATSLFLLFVYAKPDRYYPAMPFISAGCFVGYGALWLVMHFI